MTALGATRLRSPIDLTSAELGLVGSSRDDARLSLHRSDLRLPPAGGRAVATRHTPARGRGREGDQRRVSCVEQDTTPAVYEKGVPPDTSRHSWRDSSRHSNSA